MSAACSYCRQDPISNLVLSTMLEYGMGDVALVAPARDNMSFDAGPIRRKDLYEIQPYLNRLVTVALSGEDIASCLEQAASVWDEYPFDGSSPPPVARERHRGSFLVAGESFPLFLVFHNQTG